MINDLDACPYCNKKDKLQYGGMDVICMRCFRSVTLIEWDAMKRALTAEWNRMCAMVRLEKTAERILEMAVAD